MGRGCKIFVGILVLLYVAALAIWLIGSYGWFGQERDALSAAFLVMMGLPWVRLFDSAAWAVVAPLVWIALAVALCRFVSRRRQR